MLASNLLCINNCIRQTYDTEHVVLTPRRSGEEEEQVDLDPEQLTLITQKERNMSQARSDSMPKLNAVRTSSICQIGGNWTTLNHP